MENSLYKYEPQKYFKCKKVSWDDIVKKINQEFSVQSHRLLVSDKREILIVLHNNFYPGSIRSAFDEVSQDCGVSILHIYTSFSQSAPAFPRHCDKDNVVIVQAFGKIKYGFDDGSIVEMSPGDSLYIPKGIYHTPIVSEPRITLSFS